MKLIKVLAIFGLVTQFCLFSAWADDSGRTTIKAPQKEVEKEWSLEASSGVLIADIRTDNTGYTLVPMSLTLGWAMDEISLDEYCGGVFRGNTEFLFRAFGDYVVDGIESQFVGMQYGPRYNFIQPGWKFVPFVEGDVGFAFCNSQGQWRGEKQVGQGQDFCFNFGIKAGTRYDITDNWYIRVAGVFTHFSNAGLSEPARKNRSMDAAGPELSVGYRF
jgi:opacity protein-like surface antigen